MNVGSDVTRDKNVSLSEVPNVFKYCCFFCSTDRERTFADCESITADWKKTRSYSADGKLEKYVYPVTTYCAAVRVVYDVLS